MKWKLTGGIALLAGTFPLHAFGADFNEQGVFTFDPNAVHTEDFEDFPDLNEGSSTGTTTESDSALRGSKVLSLSLRDSGLPILLAVPPGRMSYRLSFWIQGDCTGGLAVDYASENAQDNPGAIAQAFPTGRITSDGWLEMQTAPLPIDGSDPNLDLRMFLAGYDGSALLKVVVDAVELVPTGEAPEPSTCIGLDLEGACSAQEMCLNGVCHPAEGWFPPLPSEEDRNRLVDYWKEKIQQTYGPYLLRRIAMPDALHTLEQARYATSAVVFWNRFAEGIRRLRDAHTYTRSASLSRLRLAAPMNVCFFEGVADRSFDVWPSDPTYRDILVSHVGPSHDWGMKQGDRLVAVDGVHPLAWVRSLMSHSLWYWESDEPLQFANLATLLQRLIPMHASTVTVVHCDAATQTCDSSPTVLEVGSMEVATGEVEQVGCDNRPFYHVPGAPEDHQFGDYATDSELVVEGWLTQSSPEEGLRGIVWNSLLGGWPGSNLDKKLKAATKTWSELATGVVQDHRQGRGGTAPTANILVGFSKENYLATVGLMRDRERDEGPQSPQEGKALFDQVKSYAGDFAGSNNPSTDIPVALLLTWNVSASDFLPYLLKGAPQVRLFGPGPTMGAFGTFFQYSYWGGLLWSIGAEDSLTPEGFTLCGRGVYPDEIVVPKQSDLLEGRDTIHEVALSWLREEIAQ